MCWENVSRSSVDVPLKLTGEDLAGQEVSPGLVILSLGVLIINYQRSGELRETNLLRCKRKKFDIESVQRQVSKKLDK